MGASKERPRQETQYRGQRAKAVGMIGAVITLLREVNTGMEAGRPEVRPRRVVMQRQNGGGRRWRDGNSAAGGGQRPPQGKETMAMEGGRRWNDSQMTGYV